MTKGASDAMFDQLRVLAFRVFPDADAEADFIDSPI